MSITIKRSFTFDAAHRVLRHGGKCRHLHGHRYVLEAVIAVENDQLDYLGMVLDFAEVKEVIGSWINAVWDHNTILNKADPLLPLLLEREERKPYVMEGNPTAENLCMEFAEVMRLRIHSPFRLVEVILYETPNCSARFIVPEKPGKISTDLR